MKKSKRQRKFLNQMRGMGDVPWPARKFKIPPTDSRLASRRAVLAERCERVIGTEQVRPGRLKRKQAIDIRCGGRRIARLSRQGKRRVYCESCRAREQQRKLELRIRKQLQARFGIPVHQAAREERRSTRMLAKFRRSGVR